MPELLADKTSVETDALPAENIAGETETTESGSRPEDRVRDIERFTGHRVRLEVYEGPLDLLLYLIRAHRYDICDIPIREVTSQFCEFISLMNELDLEYAGDFLVTAASLMQIKSRMLLPQHESQNEDALEQDAPDPRAELVERLMDLQRYQDAAETLKELREERANTFSRLVESRIMPEVEDVSASVLLQDISTFDLLRALQKVLDRQAERPVTTIRRDPFSLVERVRDVLKQMGDDGASFGALCDDCQSRLEIVITFLAILELIARKKIVVEQKSLFDEIYLKKSAE